MIAEISDLGSVREATQRIANTLGCSVALVSITNPILAMVGNTQRMSTFPIKRLRSINHILVANEISETSPEIYKLMHNHGVAAIVPFYPHNQSASGWMLLGHTFSENVYTPLDFRLVEQLFDKMSDLFLDKILLMRDKIDTVNSKLETAELRVKQIEEEAVALGKERDSLRDKNQVLLRHKHASNTTESASLRIDLFGETLDQQVEMFEKKMIENALIACQGKKSKVARMLGLRPNTLHYKIEKHKIVT